MQEEFADMISIRPGIETVNILWQFLPAPPQLLPAPHNYL